jgi:HPt (histidine-containing phosphotransfer) domain-containing protein
MNASSSPLPADLQQALDLFRAQFAEQLPARFSELRERLASWREDPASDQCLRDLHRVLHRLAGSAGTFGMPAFGEACRAIELRLEEFVGRAERSPAEVAQVAADIEALEAIAARE